MGSTSLTAAGRVDRDRLDALTAELLGFKRQGGRVLYEMGLRLKEVRDRELWRSRRYANFEAYLDQAVGCSRSTSYDAIAVAEQFNALIAQRYGGEKLKAILRYVHATPAEELPGDVLRRDPRARRFNLRELTLHQARSRSRGDRAPARLRRSGDRIRAICAPARRLAAVSPPPPAPPAATACAYAAPRPRPRAFAVPLDGWTRSWRRCGSICLNGHLAARAGATWRGTGEQSCERRA